MTPGAWRYPMFLGLSLLVFVAATFGSDLIARTSLGRQDFTKAAAEHLYYAAVQPVGTLMLLAPFLLLGWIAASTVKAKDIESALGVFLIGVLWLGFMYFSGYQDSQLFIRERKWTAATLSIGLLPFKSIPVLIICLAFRWLVVRLKPHAET